MLCSFRGSYFGRAVEIPFDGKIESEWLSPDGWVWMMRYRTMVLPPFPPGVDHVYVKGQPLGHVVGFGIHPVDATGLFEVELLGHRGGSPYAPRIQIEVTRPC